MGEGQYAIDCISPPMSPSPATALRLLPSIALSSELVMVSYHSENEF